MNMAVSMRVRMCKDFISVQDNLGCDIIWAKV